MPNRIQTLIGALGCVMASGCVETTGGGSGDGPMRPGDDVGQPSSLASYVAMSTGQLWSLQRSTTQATELLAVEAILGQRGQTRNSGAFLGQRTAGNVGQARYVRSGSGGSDDADCGDFPDAATAQAAFLSAGGPTRDPNKLDPDGDGFACGWGARLQQIAQGG